MRHCRLEGNGYSENKGVTRSKPLSHDFRKRGGRSSLPRLKPWNPMAESPVMACGMDGSPPRVEPMMAAFELFPIGERLRSLKHRVMNSRLPK
jgi:hypothetical protein